MDFSFLADPNPTVQKYLQGHPIHVLGVAARGNFHPHLIEPFRHPDTAPPYQWPRNPNAWGFVEGYPSLQAPRPPTMTTRNNPVWNSDRNRLERGQEGKYPAFMYKSVHDVHQLGKWH